MSEGSRLEANCFSLNVPLVDETETVKLGERLARVCGEIDGETSTETAQVIFLEGTLGAGKTTLTQGMLQAVGYSGPVKSPTYTLVEVYEVGAKTVCHFDLYRLSDPEELEYMGIRDYFSNQSLLVVEWPSRGDGILPAADITIIMRVDGQGRVASLNAHSVYGQRVLQRLSANQE